MSGNKQTAIEFLKMHGLGNDFVILETAGNMISKEAAKALADRHKGVGCDQLLVIEPATDKKADIFMRIFNADGSFSAACGNGTRCVAHYYMQKHAKNSCVIETEKGLLRCRMAGDLVQVDMGEPMLSWQDVPLDKERDTLHISNLLPENAEIVDDAVAVGMGNPHCVFFVEDAENLDLERYGRHVETHKFFPEKTNVEFARILSPDKIRMRVWERGAGITSACGSGACAVAVAAIRRGLVGNRVKIQLDGGMLEIEWREKDSHILMKGPVAYVFKGLWPLPEK